MKDIQVRRMDEIDGWRQKAFVLSRTDRLGRLITKTFDLILSVVRDGPNAEILLYDIESLRSEQATEIKFDSNRDDIYRSLFYGLSTSLGSMIESIQERKEDSLETAENAKEVVIQITQDKQNTAYLNNADENDQDNQYFLTGTSKVEPMESRHNLTLDAVDFNLEDLKSEPLTDHYEIDNFPVDSTSDEFVEILDSSNAYNNTDGAADESKDARDKIDQADLSYRLKCGDCGNGVKNREKLLQHYAEFHPGQKVKEAESSARKSLQCARCDYKAHFQSNLTVHMHTHTGEKPYACSQCPKKFAQTSNLYAHMRACHAEMTHDRMLGGRKRKNEKTGGPTKD
ncbi:hypothetical protein PRIPAC_75380 [Pristionchus pacificus]|uniref:Zinc finger protein n=1 Tax=Pristionchus pacificus TaxID=54126 RepID=A0A2A6C887_PRIPA|nr:hypothetical protein PRIPAC_75380 [Pristionchus pacificus]|eukprot:PDM74241.1 zinc finger protein [Pristionchus pacificus]